MLVIDWKANFTTNHSHLTQVIALLECICAKNIVIC